MSRIGKRPVPVPAGVDVKLSGSTVTVKGKNGELSFDWASEVSVVHEDGAIIVTPNTNSSTARALWGTTRARIANLVEGVSNGFERRLQLEGVGYRAQMKGRDLSIQLGFSHDVVISVPEGLDVSCDGPTAIIVKGADKQRVGQLAAEIREWRRPEPYKGKGIRYAGEFIVRKEGKKK